MTWITREGSWLILKEPLLVPEAPYEIEGGFRNNVIFPTGLVLEDSGEVKIYYGAADTVQCLAMAQLTDLVQSYAGLIPRSLLRVFVKRAADG